MSIQPFMNHTVCYTLSNESLFNIGQPCHHSIGKITVISKTPAEVAGEKILRPVIDAVTRVVSKLLSTFSSWSTTPSPSWSFLPLAYAQPILPNPHPKENDALSPYSQPSQISALHPLTLENLSSLLKQVGYQEEELQNILNKPSSDLSQSISLLTDVFFEKILSSYDQVGWGSLDKNILAQLRDSRGLTLFQAAIKDSSKEYITTLLDAFKGSEMIYALDSTGKNGLHIAAIEGKSHLVDLLTNYLSVNSVDLERLTPLHWAIHERQSQTIKALLKSGSSLVHPWASSEGVEFSPLSLAVASGDPEVLKIFLEEDNLKQVDLLQTTHRLGTLLHIAIQSNQSPMLEYILKTHHQETKKLLEQKDPSGRTPLQLAAYLGDLHAINLLHQQGAELNRGEGERGGTAVHFAALGEQPEAIKLLDFLGASLVSLNDKGESALALLQKINTLQARECSALLIKLPRMEQKDKTRPPDFMRRPPINLVFQGGGPKGIAYLGALRQLELKGVANHLRRVAGTSAGAITASLMAVGYNSQQLEPYLTRSFVELLDTEGELQKGLFNTAKEPSKKALLKTLLKEYWEGWSTLLHPVKRVKTLYDQLIHLTGLCQGEEARLWIEKLIQEATGVAHCTFGELEKLIHQNPDKYKELHLFSVKIDPNQTSQIARFSHEDPQWKDLIISDAVRASLSIPGVFKPHTLHFKDVSGKRHPRHDHGQYIDGGLIRNFPLDAFDDYKYQEDKYSRGEKTNRRTLGFSLEEVNPPLTVEQISTIETASGLAKAVISTYFHAEEILRKEKSHNQDRTLIIPIQDVTLLDFDVTPEQREAMIKAGEAAVGFFF